jgi:hypothetical protein
VQKMATRIPPNVSVLEFVPALFRSGRGGEDGAGRCSSARSCSTDRRIRPMGCTRPNAGSTTHNRRGESLQSWRSRFFCARFGTYRSSMSFTITATWGKTSGSPSRSALGAASTNPTSPAHLGRSSVSRSFSGAAPRQLAVILAWQRRIVRMPWSCPPGDPAVPACR